MIGIPYRVSTFCVCETKYVGIQKTGQLCLFLSGGCEMIRRVFILHSATSLRSMYCISYQVSDIVRHVLSSYSQVHKTTDEASNLLNLF